LRCQICRAVDGDEALEKAFSFLPDVVLLDVMMPKKDGYEVCAVLKSDPRTEIVPVIMVTALHDKSSKVRGIQAGADDFINKPTDINELRSRVITSLKVKGLYNKLAERNQELLELHEMQQNLTQMVVHDLRSPLVSIMTCLELFEIKTDGQTGFEKYIRRLQRCSATLMDMITAMLDLVKLESGEMVVNRNAVHLDHVFSEVKEHVSGLLELHGCNLKIQSFENLPRLHADYEILRRVLVNILSNAIDYTKSGNDVDVSAEVLGEKVCVRINDQGPGISKEEQAFIFDKYPKITKDGITRRYSTGLGLAFCKMAVEANQGQIGVESDSGKGTTIWLTLPVFQAAM